MTYGQGLGGIAVLESPAKAQPQAQTQGGRDGGGGLSLPKISINGATGQELDTALGTVVRFDRGGVGYIVARLGPAGGGRGRGAGAVTPRRTRRPSRSAASSSATATSSPSTAST